MARRKPRLTVNTTDTAATELEEIFRYNAKHHGVTRANRWEAFLKSKIAGLATDYDDGRPIEGFPRLRRIVAKRRSQAHGHCIVFDVDQANQTVNVLHLYHTRMDLDGRLTEEGR